MYFIPYLTCLKQNLKYFANNANFSFSWVRQSKCRVFIEISFVVINCNKGLRWGKVLQPIANFQIVSSFLDSTCTSLYEFVLFYFLQVSVMLFERRHLEKSFPTAQFFFLLPECTKMLFQLSIPRIQNSKKSCITCFTIEGK